MHTSIKPFPALSIQVCFLPFLSSSLSLFDLSLFSPALLSMCCRARIRVCMHVPRVPVASYCTHARMCLLRCPLFLHSNACDIRIHVCLHTFIHTLILVCIHVQMDSAGDSAGESSSESSSSTSNVSLRVNTLREVPSACLQETYCCDCSCTYCGTKSWCESNRGDHCGSCATGYTGCVNMADHATSPPTGVYVCVTRPRVL